MPRYPDGVELSGRNWKKLDGWSLRPVEKNRESARIATLFIMIVLNLSRREKTAVMTEPIILTTSIEGLPPPRRGKVRDIYETDEHLLIVATDRVSAFDVVLHEGISGKGRVLTQVSRFWFERLADIVPHHLIAVDVDAFPAVFQSARDSLAGRSMLVKKAEPLPVECIVRGYLAGSGWQEYRASGTVCGISLPQGLRESERLPEPIFTPSNKGPGRRT